MNSTIRRIARETWQCPQDISNSEIEGAEFDVWWDRLAGLLRGGVAGPKIVEALEGNRRERCGWDS